MVNNLSELLSEYPLLDKIRHYQPIYWQNPDFGKNAQLPLSRADVFDAAARFERFAPYFEVAFPETVQSKGILESPLIDISDMQTKLTDLSGKPIPGNLYLKADSMLPISGSIKSRGGIYEVLKFAEKIALQKTNLTYMDDYSVLASPRFHKLFSNYGIMVGSTGNLGLSIGIAAASFGFKTTVHMSVDARQWKKDLLRKHGVTVVEYDNDVSYAIAEGRKEAAKDPKIHFIDDESSRDLFLGYSVAGIRVQKQLKDLGIKPSKENPVFVYLPAGVGGSPSGVSFGLETIMPEGIYPVFAEPDHVTSVTVGMMTKLYDKIAVADLGLDGKTAADGLAVPRSSKIAGRIMDTLLWGSESFEDDDIYRYLTLLEDTEGIKVEPSAAAGFTAIYPTIKRFSDPKALSRATHIVWATGGNLVPEEEMNRYYQHGKELLAVKK